MSKDKKIYIGSQLVKQYAIADKVGVDLVGVLYENDSSEDFTNAQFEAVKSDEKYDDSQVRQRKFNDLIKNILQGMLKNNIQMLDVEFILNLVDVSVRENYKTMISKMFDVKDPTFLSLAQIDRQLKALKDKE